MNDADDRESRGLRSVQVYGIHRVACRSAHPLDATQAGTRRRALRDGAKKYVGSSTLDQVDWNAELVQRDLRNAVQQLKPEPGEGLFVSGVTLPLALADLRLIDEYEFVVHPILAGHWPTLFAGLSEQRPLVKVFDRGIRGG